MLGYYILGAMAVLFPVASYLLYLAMINGRPHPTLLSGTWDFVGVLAALSGFLLLAGPATISIFHDRWRPLVLQGEWAELGSGDLAFLWLVPWVLYALALLGGSALFLNSRRRYTLVYNVDPGVLEGLLGHIFNRLGYEAERIGNRVLVRPAVPAVVPTSALQEAIQTAPPAPPPQAEACTHPSADAAIEGKLDLDVFPSMRHVTLRWRRARGTLREDTEAELARQLLEVDTVDNPAANWLLTIASCLFSAIFLGLVGFILVMMQRR